MSTSDWSLPKTAVFDQIRTALEEGSAAVLATVVAVEGSAYRRPGAKMLLSPDGLEVGSITAGCLEDEVRTLAADVLADEKPRVETWDLTGDNDVWGLGVGCNGVITVLLEPLGASYRPIVDAYQAGETIGVVTVIESETDTTIGDRVYYHTEDGFEGERFSETIRDELEAPLQELIEFGSAETRSIDSTDDSTEVYLEGVRPPPELVIFGSGHDVDPVVELAKLVDFRVTVLSFRGGQADADQFPRADAVMSASPHEISELRQWDRDTYAVVMSHNFIDDRLALEQLLETPVPYIGLMGPQKRFDEMREEFAGEGRMVTQAELERIYTPIGLSLGGDSPFQIAFSIVGELLAVAHDRTPQHLTQRTGPIHDRTDITPD